MIDLSKISKPLVIFHKGCRDGWAAAFLAKLRWPDADLQEASYGDEPLYWPAAGRDVIVVDFSYPRDRLLLLRLAARSLHVFDHHAKAAADLAGLDFCVFDMERSGAGLALDVFFPGAREEGMKVLRR